MCDCIKTITEKLTAHLIEQKGIKPEAVISAEFNNNALLLTDTGVISRMVMPFTLRYKWFTKAQKEKEGKVESSMTMSFCPMCGEEIN